MPTKFETQKNKKALTLTLIICTILLILAFVVTWPVQSPAHHSSQDLIEINLGNDMEGFGEIQPLIKGEMSSTPSQSNSSPTPAEEKNLEEAPALHTAEDNEAPAIEKPVKPKTNITTTTTQPKQQATSNTRQPKPQKPRFTYSGPGNGNGNNATEDNGYTYQGNKPGGTGDAGSPTGNPDSYGNSPGGATGGVRVVNGDRKIVRSYSFTGDLDKATIYATIKVSPEGKGQFMSFAKNSSSRNPAYASAITGYLKNMQFDKTDHESIITVQFNFTVN